MRGGSAVNGKHSPTYAHRRDREFKATKYCGNGRTAKTAKTKDRK